MWIKCPKWFTNWVTAGTIPPGAVDPDTINDLYEVVQQHSRDISTLNTGFGRVERKQNRWIEILNIREAPDGGLQAAAAPASLDRPPAFAGAETEELVL